MQAARERVRLRAISQPLKGLCNRAAAGLSGVQGKLIGARYGGDAHGAGRGLIVDQVAAHATRARRDCPALRLCRFRAHRYDFILTAAKVKRAAVARKRGNVPRPTD